MYTVTSHRDINLDVSHRITTLVSLLQHATTSARTW